LVAIVGAPNVGKSTLFNRLVGRRQAIVTDEPGVTRYRLYGEVRDVSCPLRLVDTGGLTPNTAAPFAREIEQQAGVALAEASVILFVVDVRAGATAFEDDIARMLRRRRDSVIVVANKVDAEKVADRVHEFHRLGLGEPFPVSAEHGLGFEPLLEEIVSRAAAAEPIVPDEADRPAPLRVAIFGRPNVGKSSLLNRLAGEERVLVSDIPGTTRDAIDSLVELDGRAYLLIDTAGLRRRGRARLAAERFSVARARRNIGRCDVALLILDAEAGFAAQDAHIAGYITEAHKPMIVAVNKWDLIGDREEQAKQWEERVRHRLRFAKQVPMLLISAKTGQRVTRVLELADELQAYGAKRVRTPELNVWLHEVAGSMVHGGPRGPSLRLYYATQVGSHPPNFVVFCNDPRKVHFSFRRYLENSLRDRFEFAGSPLRITFRRRRRES